MNSGVKLMDEGLIKVLMKVNEFEDTKFLSHIQGFSKIVPVSLHILSVDAELLHNLGLEARKHLVKYPLLELSVEEGILVPNILGGGIRVHPSFLDKLSWRHLCQGYSLLPRFLGCCSLGLNGLLSACELIRDDRFFADFLVRA